jgi:hypothetical protein
MHKAALFVFNRDPMCFIHVLLNALDLDQKGGEARIVIEGAATGLIPELEKADHPLNKLWQQVKSKGLVEGVCKACASKMDTLSAAQAIGLQPLDDMLGHPGMAGYRQKGFDIITI